jgi:hypothetical protein
LEKIISKKTRKIKNLALKINGTFLNMLEKEIRQFKKILENWSFFLKVLRTF